MQEFRVSAWGQRFTRVQGGRALGLGLQEYRFGVFGFRD